MSTPRSSRTFVSYSHDSPAHMARVLALATRLVTEGVDARLDQWIVEPEGGWPLWTERQVVEAEFVLVVCTDIYRQRVENPEKVAGGAGSYWEANFIRNRLYDGKGVNERFIPVFFGESGAAAIPEMLEGFTYYQIDSPEGYLALYRRVTNQPVLERPEVGKIVVLPRQEPVSDLAREATRQATSESSLPAAVAFSKLTPLTDCDEKGLRSLEGSISTYVRFDNYLPAAVDLYWINYEGERVYYASLEAGRSYLQQTYVTHPWVVTRKDASSGLGQCVAIFQPAAEPGVAEIKERGDSH